MSDLEIECSFALRKKIRNFLNKCIFDGDEITYLEEKHFGGSVFYIKGAYIFTEPIYKAIRNHTNG